MGGHQKRESTRDLGRWEGLRPEPGPDGHLGAREEKEVAPGHTDTREGASKEPWSRAARETKEK